MLNRLIRILCILFYISEAIWLQRGVEAERALRMKNADLMASGLYANSSSFLLYSLHGASANSALLSILMV
jgi:hypothetical protein